MKGKRARKTTYRKGDEAGSPDSKGATEDQMVNTTIKGSETLGYKGEAKGEHSGQNSPRRVPDPTGDLANQNPKKR